VTPNSRRGSRRRSHPHKEVSPSYVTEDPTTRAPFDPLSAERTREVDAAPTGDRNRPSRQRSRRRGWSIYGAEGSQPGATGGKWDGAENGSNKPKPLPSVAVSCVHNHMVRRRIATACRLPLLAREEVDLRASEKRSSPANPKARRTREDVNSRRLLVHATAGKRMKRVGSDAEAAG
jgi:hypothetical protein